MGKRKAAHRAVLRGRPRDDGDNGPPGAHAFGIGDRVAVAERSVVVDRARALEYSKGRRKPPTLEADVTGAQGEIIGTAYASADKGGEVCYPVQLPNQAVVGVPARRLERAFESRRMFVGGGDPRMECGYAIAFQGAAFCTCGSHNLPPPPVAAAPKSKR